jgi:hypothetical protein
MNTLTVFRWLARTTATASAVCVLLATLFHAGSSRAANDAVILMYHNISD